jgi:hypothetical protein
VVSNHAAGGLFAQSKMVVTTVAVQERQFTLRFHLEQARRVQIGYGNVCSGMAVTRSPGASTAWVCVRGMTLQRCVVVAAMTVRDAACKYPRLIRENGRH